MVTPVGVVRSIVTAWASEPAVPADVRARTSKVWAPALSVPSVSGLAQAAQTEPSIRHSNVAVPRSELNWNVGDALLDGSAGPESIVVSGAVLSISHV